MKHIFSSLLSAGASLLAAVLWSQLAFGQAATPLTQLRVAKVPAGDPATTSAPADSAPGDGRAGQGAKVQATSGQELVAAAANRVHEEQAVAAELRYKIDAFGHQLVGTGQYLQLGAGPEKLLRLDLKMQVGDKQVTLQEICGSEYYWLRRDVPPAPATLGRVNLRQLRRTLTRAARVQPGEVMPNTGWIMLGGLPRLLASLEQNFDFGAAQPEELQYTAADGQSVRRLSVWVVDGRWKADRLAALTGGESAKTKAAALPKQLPDRVRVVLGRTEGVLPLFPYRITYWRQAAEDEAAGGAGEGTPRELMSLELFNVHRKGDIDPREFDYNPGEQEVQDLTTAYVQRFNGATKVR